MSLSYFFYSFRAYFACLDVLKAAGVHLPGAVHVGLRTSGAVSGATPATTAPAQCRASGGALSFKSYFILSYIILYLDVN